MKKRMLLASTVALSFAPVLATQAEEVLWTARSVEQIQNDLTKTDNKTSYTVQYGDTLSTIAEALGVDVTVLANLNKITNMDLIFPETVLTTTVNEAEEVTEVEIQTPQADSSEEVTTATADLTTNQVTVDDQTVQVADLSQPIAEAPKNEDNQPIDRPIRPDGASAYFSSLPIKAMVQAIKKRAYRPLFPIRQGLLSAAI